MKKNDLPAIGTKEMTETLNWNAKTSVETAQKGKDLLRVVESEGIDDAKAETMRLYVQECSSQVCLMHEARRPFTERLVEWQRQFVAMENAIDPKKADSPAAICNKLLREFLNQKIEARRREEQRLERNYQQSQRRIERNRSLTAEERQAAYMRAEKRRIDGHVRLSVEMPDIILVPHILSPDGYLELLKFWWERIGRFLPDRDLQRIFHPMIMYARQQAKRGEKVECESVVYKEEAA